MLDRELLNKLKYPVIGLFISLLLYLALVQYYTQSFVAIAIMQSLAYIFTAVVLVLLVDYMCRYWEDSWKKEQRESLIQSVEISSKIIKGIIILVFILFIVNVWVGDFNTFLRQFIRLIAENRFTKPILIFTIYLVIAQSILHICKTYINEAIRKHEYSWGDLIIEKTEYPLSWIIILYGIKITFLSIGVKYGFTIPLIHSAIILLITHIGIAVSDALVENWERHWVEKTKSKFNEEFIVILHNFAKLIIIILGVLFVLREWGIEIKSLLLSLGVLGVILGFALKDSLGNIIGGISLMLDRSFKTGDVLKLEDDKVGEVVHVGLRTTHLKTFDNELMIIPNAKLADSEIINYAKPNNIVRLRIPVNVAYGSNVDKVKKVLVACAKKHPEIENPDLIDARFMEMSDYSLSFQLLFYIRNYRKRYRVKNEMTAMVYKAMEKNGIEIPFPTRTLYMNKGKRKTRVQRTFIVKKKTTKRKKNSKKKR